LFHKATPVDADGESVHIAKIPIKQNNEADDGWKRYGSGT